MNRIESAIEEMRNRLMGLPQDKIDSLEETSTLEFDEHFQFQNEQARAHAMGIISTDEAQIIYRSLGESMSTTNGGWQMSADLATKIVIIKIMSELLGRRVA